MDTGRSAVVTLVTGQAGTGKTTVVRAACELVVARTGWKAVQLEFDDFMFAVVDPAAVADPTAPPSPDWLATALQLATGAIRAGTELCGWVVLEGFLRRQSLEYLRSHLDVAGTYGFVAPRGICWERNEGRGHDDRLPKSTFDRLWDRFDVGPDDDAVCWLDTTLPADVLAKRLADEVLAFSPSRLR